MRELTKAEEQIMQILWSLGNGTVSDVREQFEEPRPARTTVATVLTILENKGFLSHTSDDRSNLYTPLITKKEYSHTQLFGMMRNYFDGRSHRWHRFSHASRTSRQASSTGC